MSAEEELKRAHEAAQQIVGMFAPLKVGDVLDGPCGYYFAMDEVIGTPVGRKVVEGIGDDWVVVREEGFPALIAWCDPNDLIQWRVTPIPKSTKGKK